MASDAPAATSSAGENPDESQPLMGARPDSSSGGARQDEEGGVGALLAAIVIAVALVPLPSVLTSAYGMPAPAARTGAVAMLMASCWALEPIPLPVTSLLPVVLLPILGVLPASHVAVQYMNNSNLLFLGSLFVATAVEQAGLHRRAPPTPPLGVSGSSLPTPAHPPRSPHRRDAPGLALGVLVRVGTQPHTLLLGFMVVCAFLSMFISNSATAACMLPIARTLIRTVRPPPSPPLLCTLFTHPRSTPALTPPT